MKAVVSESRRQTRKHIDKEAARGQGNGHANG